jgi:hypothetical protein
MGDRNSKKNSGEGDSGEEDRRGDDEDSGKRIVERG